MENYVSRDLKNIYYFCDYHNEWRTEIFKDIPDYEGLYQVSDLGRVKSLKRIQKMPKGGIRIWDESILCRTEDSDGYYRLKLTVNCKSKTFRIHQLVAIAFLKHTPDKFNFVVNHKDINKKNNKLSNLEIVTNRVNCNLKHIAHTSKYTGVSWVKDRKKWLAQILINGKIKNLGRFEKEYDAHLAYEKALSKC